MLDRQAIPAHDRRMSTHRFLVVTALVLGSGPVVAQAPAGWSDFTRLFQTYVDSDRVVGASALMMKDGRVLARRNAGYADRTGNVAVNDETIFHWGSITKTLTAIAVMQLRDTYVGPAGITWLHRWALTAGKRGPFFAGEPTVPQYIERAANNR